MIGKLNKYGVMIMLSMTIMLCYSCGSKKQIVKTNIATETKTESVSNTSETKDTFVSSTNAASERKDISTDNQGTTIKIEFDTEKGIDTITNLAPIKTITIHKTAEKTQDKSEIQQRKTIVDTTKINSNTNIKESEATKVNETVEVVTEHKESKKLKWIMWIVWGVAATLISFTAYKIINKIKK